MNKSLIVKAGVTILVFCAVTFSLTIFCPLLFAQDILTSSPDKNIVINFRLGSNGEPQYSISAFKENFVLWSNLGMDFKDGGLLDRNFKVLNVSTNTINETYKIIAGKSAYARNYCNETKVLIEETSGLKRQLEIYFRAYNDGCAFRYGIPSQANINDFILQKENTEFKFAGNYDVWAMRQHAFKNSYEGPYLHLNVQSINNAVNDAGKKSPDSLVTLPLTIKINPDLYCTYSEAEINDYPGMYLMKSNNDNALLSVLSPHPENSAIADAGKTPFLTPWRVFIITRKPGDLLVSNLITNLNEPLAIDASWIKPGKSAWDYWAGSTGFPAGFGFGMNDKTWRYYIDFAAQNNLEYVTIDAGWNGYFDANNESQKNDLTKSVPAIDLPALAAYANSKGIGLFVWSLWFFVRDQMDEAFTYYEKIGVKGVKIDFMERDDQAMVKFYHDVLRKAAEHKLLINFHGAYKPDGITRTYPNLITREGVLGNEYAKGVKDMPNPDYDVTLPFTRMVAGPMDYTPGSMRNSYSNEVPNNNSPVTLGTRAQQLAMFVVFESPLQTLCDAPPVYEKSDGFDFIKTVPASWDSTIVLDGRIGEYIIIARKSGNDWYIGALTGWQQRDIEIPLSFLDNRSYSADIYSDAENTDKNPESISHTNLNADKSKKLNIHLAPAGGAAIHLKSN